MTAAGCRVSSTMTRSKSVFPPCCPYKSSHKSLTKTYNGLIMSAMMTILWERKAIRQLKKIREEDRRQITTSVQSLSDWPDCRNVKAMINHKYQYRLRVGRYRVFFNMEISLHILKIEEVKKRDESTY